MKTYAWIYVLLAIVTLSGCRMQAVTASTNSTDSVRQTIAQVRVDSVYVRDSIYIRDHGDTVFVERWHVRWRERAVAQTDTVYIERQQSEVKVPPPQRYVPKFYKWCTGILFVLLLIGVIRILWKWKTGRLCLLTQT